VLSAVAPTETVYALSTFAWNSTRLSQDGGKPWWFRNEAVMVQALLVAFGKLVTSWNCVAACRKRNFCTAASRRNCASEMVGTMSDTL
jgi:hypothetical protein